MKRVIKINDSYLTSNGSLSNRQRDALTVDPVVAFDCAYPSCHVRTVRVNQASDRNVD